MSFGTMGIYLVSLSDMMAVDSGFALSHGRKHKYIKTANCGLEPGLASQRRLVARQNKVLKDFHDCRTNRQQQMPEKRSQRALREMKLKVSVQTAEEESTTKWDVPMRCANQNQVLRINTLRHDV